MNDQDTSPRVLGPVDLAFIYVETDKSPMNIGAVAIFDGKITYDALVEHVDSRIHMAPLYQRRLVQAPLNLGQPTWQYDPNFYVGNHIFKRKLSAPGTDDQLRDLTGRVLSSTLDRSKPLWEIHLIEGLSDNRTALFFKVHHAMVDGLAAIELFTILLDLTPDMPASRNKPLYDPPYLPGPLELVKDGLLGEIPNKVQVIQKIGGNLSFLGSVIGDKEKRRKLLRGVANLINDNLTPIKPLAINGKNSGQQELSWAEFPMAEVRAIRSNANVSVNDVMLAVLAGAIAKYQKRHGRDDSQKFVRMLVPVNVRMEEEKGAFGNRISVLPVDVPLEASDPMQRLHMASEYSSVMKNSYLANSLDTVLTLPSLAASAVQPLIWAVAPKAFAFLAHTWCTNVAGPQIPVYLRGCELIHSYGFFPLNPSMGLACVIMSYNQRVTMTLVTDSGIIRDATELREYLEESYVELRQAAKVTPIEPVLIERSKMPEPAPVVEKAMSEKAPTGSASVAQQKVEAEPTAVPATVSTPDAPPIAAIEPSGSAPVPVAPQAAVLQTPPSVVASAAAPGPAITAMVEVETPPVDAPTANGASQPTTMVGNADAATDFSANGDTAPTADRPVSGTGAAAEGEASTKSDATGSLPDVSGQPEAAPAKTEPEQPKRMKLFSEEWAQAFQDAINASAAYRRASTKWTAGSLSFVMRASPAHGFPDDCAVLMDLFKGECRSAHARTVREVMSEAAFVIEGDYRSWMKVMRGESAPLMALMRGELHLKKGALMKLLPFTQSAQELLNCAQRVPWE